MSCLHKSTYELPDWPRWAMVIEVCNCCGMSRAHWEQGVSDWQQVDLYQARKEMEFVFEEGEL